MISFSCSRVCTMRYRTAYRLQPYSNEPSPGSAERCRRAARSLIKEEELDTACAPADLRQLAFASGDNIVGTTGGRDSEELEVCGFEQLMKLRGRALAASWGHNQQ
jgi:hypothetical protein